MPLRTRGSSRLATLSFVLGCACSVAAISSACDTPTAPLPTGAIAWSPPARFALWWRMTESCSGRRGDLQSIKWFIVPDARSIDIGGRSVQGVTIGDRIVLADAYRLNGSLVRHEMLHALLRGATGHPRDAFLGACNDVVVCDSVCEADAGGRLRPPPDAAELVAREVATRVEVVPGLPAASKDSGAVAIIVSITNPRATSAWVRLAPPGSSDAIGYSFGLEVDYDDTGRARYRGQTGIEGTRFPLGPNETRRYVWDLSLSPGAYGVRGWFNDDTTSRFALNVGP